MAKYTINDIKRINTEKGYHFFDETAMRGFSSRVYDDVTDNGCFITSEQDKTPGPYKAWGGKRRYTIRQFDPETGDIDSVSGWGEYETLAQAKYYLKKYHNN